MATIIVATASPPFAEGGHLVMARELVRALEECGHVARCWSRRRTASAGRAAAYLAAWCTDVSASRTKSGASIRSSRCAFRPTRSATTGTSSGSITGCASTTTCGISSRRTCRSVRRSKSACGARIIHRVDQLPADQRVQRLFVISGTVQARLQRVGRPASPTCCTRRRRVRAVPLRRLRRLPLRACRASRRSSASTCSCARWPSRRRPASAA